MKKIINGKLYNTEIATYIGSYESGYYPSDFKYYEEELYQKKTGEFFLNGSGGSLTKYAVCFGNSRGSGSAIIPLTTQEAKKWVEECLSMVKYVELFGEPEE